MSIPHRSPFQRRPSFLTTTNSSRTGGAGGDSSSSSSSATHTMLPEPAALILRRFLLLVAVSLSCYVILRASDSLRFLPRFPSSSSSAFPYIFPSVSDDSPPVSSLPLLLLYINLIII